MATEWETPRGGGVLLADTVSKTFGRPEGADSSQVGTSTALVALAPVIDLFTFLAGSP